MKRQRFQNWFWLLASVVLASAVLVSPVVAQNQTAQTAKKRTSVDLTARLQAQAIAQAAQRAEQRAKERASELTSQSAEQKLEPKVEQKAKQGAEINTPISGQHNPAPPHTAWPSRAASNSSPAAPGVVSGQSGTPDTVPSWPVDQAPSAGIPLLGVLSPQAPPLLLPAVPMASAISAVIQPELAIAQHIHQGLMRCELGASVQVEADASRPGYFNVQGKGFRYRMSPVPTSTGALRLEDKKAGAVWLQLANKSMLMDQKKGRRMADECAHPEQVAFVQATQNLPPTELFDTTGMGRPLD